MRIEWLISGTQTNWVEENYQDGGYVYDTYLRKILRSMYDVNVTYLWRGNQKSKIKRAFQFGKYLFKNAVIRYKGDIVVRDVFSTVFAPFDRKRKHIVILQHIDASGRQYDWFYKAWTKQFFKRVSLASKVVVVSEYWKGILERAGCSNVTVIRNPFELNLFDFSQHDLSDFHRNLGIPEGKPVIYLGNARPEKGYLESYEVLKNIDAIFVTTGKNKVDLPVLHKFLSYDDYLKLLKISTLVITMSKFNEGWCRTAHEAMLCGTPVIGSGKGGMRELLERGNQIICDSFDKLGPLVTDLISDEKKLEDMAIQGKKFASQFTLDYFKKSWIDLLASLS